MSTFSNHSQPQHSRFNSFVIGVFSAATVVVAGLLTLAGFATA
jgi:hypothetical protein